jgi:hypothetical protein
VEKALAFSAMDDVRDQAAAEREDAARQVAAGERTEALVVGNRLGGDALGNLQRARAAEEAADDECRDLAALSAKAEAKRDRARGNVEFWAQRAAEVTGQAQRSAPPGVEGALSRAQEALRQEASRRKVDAMLAQRSASRPVSLPKRMARMGAKSAHGAGLLTGNGGRVRAGTWRTTTILRWRRWLPRTRLRIVSGERERVRPAGASRRRAARPGSRGPGAVTAGPAGITY